MSKERKELSPVVQWRACIVEDVTTSGLKSALRVFGESGRPLVSADGKGSFWGHQIRGRVIKPDTPLEEIQKTFYGGGFGVLSTVIERSSEEDIIYSREYWGRKISREQIEGLSERARASFLVVSDEANGEVKETSIFESSRFSHLIIPQAVLGELEMMKTLRPNMPVIPVAETIERRIGPYILQVPDYESVIKRILEQGCVPIWVHGVRLPVEDDLLKVA